MKIIGKLLTAVFFVFGVLFIIGSVNNPNPGRTFVTGVVLLVICLALGFFSFRKTPAPLSNDQNITYKIDIPANVSMDAMKCQACGGTLSPKDVAMVAGAPVVTCPFCHSTYQLTEDPKW
jgi:preprotein translocase subunit SecG